jgi:hypothetical protein
MLDEADDVQKAINKSETSLQNETIRDSNVSSSFKDFLLKSELLRFVMDFGFEHPSEGFI